MSAANDIGTRPEIALAFLTAGDATCTLSNGTGKHYTYKFKRGQLRQGYPDVPYLVSVLVDGDRYEYAALVTHAGMVIRTKGSKFQLGDECLKALTWMVGRIWKGRPIPEPATLQHAGRCGVCDRELTDPVSIELGIGPICRGKR